MTEEEFGLIVEIITHVLMYSSAIAFLAATIVIFCDLVRNVLDDIKKSRNKN